MAGEKLIIERAIDRQAIPINLLELADPSLSQIMEYLPSGKCFLARLNAEIIGVMILKESTPAAIEIKNIAIKPTFQGKGFGKLLLRHADQVSRQSGYKKLIIGTGNSSVGQLAFYQKEGFEMIAIEKDFFLKNYREPIFENGIRCKHRIILEKDLT